MRKRYLYFYEAVGELLTKRMAEMKISKHELAKKTKQSHQTISNMCNARCRFLGHQLVWLHEEMNISLDDIMACIQGKEQKANSEVSYVKKETRVELHDFI